MNDMFERLEVRRVLQQIAHHASFSLGKNRILESQMISKSLLLNRELRRLSAAMEYVETNPDLSMAGISDISMALSLANKGGVLAIEDIVVVGRNMKATHRLKNEYQKGDFRPEALEDLFESLDVDASLIKDIEHVFSDHGEVLDRASTLLKELRQELKRAQSSLDTTIQSFLKNHSDSLVEQVVTYTQGRPTFLIKLSDKNKYPGVVYGTSASGQSVYFEPAQISNIQNNIQVLKHQESQEIERLCSMFTYRIGGSSGQLFANLETLSIIDALFAKAQWGIKRNAVVATLSDRQIYLKDAIHPLIDPKTVVANTYELTPPYTTILISGPNTGGKSVSLKTIGLATLMAHMAMPVCASKAIVKHVDHIFVDIGDQQSIEQSLSSFSAHMKTLNEIVQQATSKSLVLLDELGSQTDPLEGESLAMAVIDYFRSIGSSVIATTHFGRLKQYGSFHDDILVASVEFNMETLAPTYKYKPHLLGESNALAIAKRLGLQADILDAAFTYKQEGQYEADHLIEVLEEKIFKQDQMMEEINAARQQLDADKTSFEAELKSLKDSLESEKIALHDAYQDKLDDLVKEAQAVVSLINEETRPDFRKKHVQQLASKQSDILHEHLMVGDLVSLKQTGQQATIKSINKNRAEVSVHGLIMHVDLAQLTWISSAPKVAKVVKKRSTHHVQTFGNRSLELNLIGQRVEAALPQVSKFIDNALVQRTYRVRIVHGHGTGVLRKAVQEELKRNKHVASFELAPVNEGGAGATVVNLKS